MTSEQRRHGGPEDRGSADRYYGRAYNPHYYVGETYVSDRISAAEMTEVELEAYKRGYETETDEKQWTSL